jgi:hypothetical protein
LDKPSAHANTIRDRNANACAELARRDHRVNVFRSSSVSVNVAFGRPVFGIPDILYIENELWAQDTSRHHAGDPAQTDHDASVVVGAGVELWKNAGIGLYSGYGRDGR